MSNAVLPRPQLTGARLPGCPVSKGAGPGCHVGRELGSWPGGRGKTQKGGAGLERNRCQGIPKA